MCWYDSGWGLVGQILAMTFVYHAGKKRGINLSSEEVDEIKYERPRKPPFDFQTMRSTPPPSEPSENDMDAERQRWRLQSQERTLKNQLKSVKERQKTIRK